MLDIPPDRRADGKRAVGMTYGYVRVSSRDQNEARQMIAMRENGIDPGRIFLDKQSGKDFNRPEYRRMLRRLQPGDLLVVKSIDRLGRNYDEILEQWRLITKQKDCDIAVLDMPLLDTAHKGSNGLMGKVISDIVLQLLSYVAQTEREAIKQRQAEGIAAAKARGQRFGRPRLERTADYRACYEAWRADQMSAAEAGRRLRLSRNTFLKWAREDMRKEAEPWPD